MSQVVGVKVGEDWDYCFAIDQPAKRRALRRAPAPLTDFGNVDTMRDDVLPVVN